MGELLAAWDAACGIGMKVGVHEQQWEHPWWQPLQPRRIGREMEVTVDAGGAEGIAGRTFLAEVSHVLSVEYKINLLG